MTVTDDIHDLEAGKMVIPAAFTQEIDRKRHSFPGAAKFKADKKTGFRPGPKPEEPIDPKIPRSFIKYFHSFYAFL